MAESESAAQWLDQLCAIALEQSFQLVRVSVANGIRDCVESFSS